MSEGRPARVTIIKLACCCLLAGVVVAALMFPLAGGLGLVSNRASDIVANGSAQLLEGDVPQVTTMVDAAGNPIAWLYSQRRFEVPTDQIANTMKLAIVSIEDWSVRLPRRRPQNSRRFDDRAAVRQELSTAGDGAE